MADYGEMFYGTLPQDTQDMDAVLRGVGRSLREIGRSTQYLPYDVLGAPVDLATMAMRPFGYDAAQPVGGSDWLIEMSRRMGIADQPTGSGIETATRFATGVPSPVAVPRALAGIGRFVDMLGETPPTGAIRMYHGTDKAFDDYRVKDRGLAYYFTPDPEQAGFYSGMGEGANIRPVELNVKNTYRGGDVEKIMDVVKKEDDYYPYSLSKIQESLENQTPLAFHTPSVVKALKKLGYDSFAEYEGGIEQIGVFSAKDVKPSFGAGLLDEPAQSVAASPLENPKADELNALKVRLDELNNQFATDTAPPSAVREHGAVMKRYQELQDELYPRPQTTPAEVAEETTHGLLDTSYRGGHSAPSRESGAQLHQLDQIFPDDIYSPQAARNYGHYGGNDPMDRQTMRLAQSLRGKPDADVTIYRAVPKDEKIKDINQGDWVTINKQYAKEHGESVLLGDYKILEKKVKAKDIWTNADSIHEYGYDPD